MRVAVQGVRFDVGAAGARGLGAWRRDAVSAVRFAAGMTMIGGVFVLVQALLLLEQLWPDPGATPPRELIS